MILTSGAYHQSGDWPAVEAAPGVAVDSFHPVRDDYR